MNFDKESKPWIFLFLFIYFFIIIFFGGGGGRQGEGLESGGRGGGRVGQSKNDVKLQTRVITEFMYTTYSFCYNLHFQVKKGSLVNNF